MHTYLVMNNRRVVQPQQTQQPQQPQQQQQPPQPQQQQQQQQQQQRQVLSWSVYDFSIGFIQQTLTGWWFEPL